MTYPPKCEVCGRFISDKDYFEGKTGGEVIPFSEFTKEEIIHWHLDCVKKESEDVSSS